MSTNRVVVTGYGVTSPIGNTPEETMRNMGEIASPGMIGTEKTILDILQRKGNR